LLEGIIGGDENFWDCASFRPGEICRNLRQKILVTHQVFGMGTARCNAEYTLADVPFGRACTEINDLTGEFKAGDIGADARRRRILALALQCVSTVQG
jgi:hypothetical protein